MIRTCECEDYPCCGHGESEHTEPPYCDQCGGYHYSIFSCEVYEDNEESPEELPVELRVLTALVEPINDAITNLLEDELMGSILDTLRDEGKLCGDWDYDQELAEKVHDKCLEIIGEKFKR